MKSSDRNSICWEDISAFHKLFVADGGGKEAVLSELPRECAILISFLGARFDNRIVRNERAATATQIYEPFAVSVSLKEMAACIAGSKPAVH